MAETLIIEAGRTERHYWKDLWRYRELFYFLAWRDILVRYKQTAIGVAWAVVRPLTTMVVFTLIFGNLAKFPSNEVPYAVMVFAALVPWQFFASAFTEASNSLVNNAGLISKVYFPRMIIPISGIIVSGVDCGIAGLILVAMILWHGIVPDWRLIVLPIFIALAFLTALGTGLWVAALNVRYRDFRHLVPFVVQVGLFISPVGFNSDMVPERWRLLYSLNPMANVIDGFRWALFRGSFELYWPGLVGSVLLIIVGLVSGVRYFRRTEKSFADII